LSIPLTQAATIEYVVTDLSDVTPGEDLWRYDYTVSGRSFAASEYFDIYFASSLYGTLTPGPAPNADWDVMILEQPDPTKLPPFDRGMFDVFALNAGPSLAGAFSVTFPYLGSGTPGAQPFEIFDASSNLLESGVTVPAGGVVPEPSTVALFALGLGGCALRLRRRFEIHR
jgi:hypothetical protein